MNKLEFSPSFFSLLQKNGYAIVPIEPTEEMMDAWYEGAEAARDAFFEERRRRNEVRVGEGKRPFPYGIAPVEWFPPAYRAMLLAASEKWREEKS